MINNGNILQEPYQKAMTLYLKNGTATRLRSARHLGRRAVKLGLETLDLAIIHEESLLTLIEGVSAPAERRSLINKARTFYAESILALEETHRAAKEANAHLRALNEALNQRTNELNTSNRKLLKEVARRQIVEINLRHSQKQSTQLLNQSKILQEQLRHLSRRIMSAQEDEKRRISRDLHDIVAQMLSGINLRLATLKTDLTANSKGLGKKIQSTQRLVEKSVDVVHRFARELRPAVLDDLGLLAALHSLVNTYSKQTGIRVHLTVFAGVKHLENSIATVLFRVAQEALTNVSRHAHANQVNMSIRQDGQIVRMIIKDDGRSFDVHKVFHTRRSKRLGLLGMRERVEMVGGTFSVTSAPGHGTSVCVEIPMDDRSRRAVHK